MTLLRHGNLIINVDRMTAAAFRAKDPPDFREDRLDIEFGGHAESFSGPDARHVWRLLNSLRPMGDCDPPTPEEALAECYLVRIACVPPDGPHLWSAPSLADLVARVAGGWAHEPGEYRIDLDGEIWGFLVRHDERRWMIRSKDGSVMLTPGDAAIL